MDSEAAKKAEKVLSNNEYLKKFAALNKMNTEAAKDLLESLLSPNKSKSSCLPTKALLI